MSEKKRRPYSAFIYEAYEGPPESEEQKQNHKADVARYGPKVFSRPKLKGEEKRFPQFDGNLPPEGTYQNRCLDCGELFLGEKHARICEDCLGLRLVQYRPLPGTTNFELEQLSREWDRFICSFFDALPKWLKGPILRYFEVIEVRAAKRKERRSRKKFKK